ncbi:MAG: hypothetical protein ABI178_09225 [Rhodanobacter sp.]
MPIDQKKAAQRALYAMYAEDLFDSLKGLANSHGTPALGAPLSDGMTLSAADWDIAGEIRASDSLGLLSRLAAIGDFAFDRLEYFYGFLLHRKTPNGVVAQGDYLVIVRGTELTVEWALDACATPVNYPLGNGDTADVPIGFHAIYSSMVLVTQGGARSPLASGITQVVGAKNVTVAGHSLGAALGTYLAFDLASGALGQRVDAALVASPSPGDAKLAERFYDVVASYTVVNWERDDVPKVPPYPFVAVRGSTQLTLDDVTVSPTNALDPACNHHAICYARMLDPTLVLGPSYNCF